MGVEKEVFFKEDFLRHHKIKGFSNLIFFSSFPEEEIVKASPWKII